MTHSAPHYQVGGAIQVGALYVRRQADRELVDALCRGEFCYILAPRQIGKSSLRIRAGDDLMLAGVRCVSIDLSGIGTSQVTQEQWYYSIAYEIAVALNIDFEAFWDEHTALSPVHRWNRFLRDLVLEQIHEPVVVFIDEVDSVLTLDFEADDFFASIRAVYNLRAEYPNYERLTFCLLGVAAPSELIQNPALTPFNIGREIRLEDFVREEVTSFAEGLEIFGPGRHRMLDAVYAWTSGHPYMTQRLCNELVRRGPLKGEKPIDRVDDVAYTLFIRNGRTSDAAVAYAEKRLDRTSRSKTRQLLHLYRKLLDGERVPAEPNNILQTELRLMGIAAETRTDDETYLRSRNLIFAEVYDHAWLKAKERTFRLAEVVEVWVESGKRDDYLLRGEALEDALEWSKGRNDLTVTEHEFLLAAVELARREAEARTRIAEAMRKEGESRIEVAEERTRTEQERYRGDLERERRERAEDSANSQRRLVVTLTAAVLSLLGVLAWTVAERWRLNKAKTDLHDFTARQMHKSRVDRIEHMGEKALLLSRTPGQAVQALVTAIKAAGEGAQLDQEMPSSVMEGLVGAVATPPADPVILQHGGRIYHAAFSRDGTKVLTASADRTAKVWGAASGRLLLNLGRHRSPVGWVGYSRDQTRLVTISHDQTTQLWNTLSGESLADVTAASTTGFYPVVDPDFRRVLLAGRGATATLWDLRRDIRVGGLGSTGSIVTASFSNDGELLATASSDGTLQLWQADDARFLGRLPAPAKTVVRSFQFSPDDARLFALGDSGVALLWRTEERQLVTSQLDHGDATIEGARFSPDSNTLTTFANDGSAAFWDPVEGFKLAATAGLSHNARIRDVVYSHDSTRVVTVSDDHTARLWGVPSGELLVTIEGHKGPVRTAAFSPDDTRLVTAGDDHTARLWNPTNGARLATLEGHSLPITHTEFSPDGFRVLTVSDDRTARVWSAGITNPIRTLRQHRGPVNKVVYSPAGHRLVSGGDERAAYLWDTSSNAVVATLGGHLGPVIDAVFAPTGKDRLATIATGDETVHLWEATTGALVRHIEAHDGPVLSTAFDRTGEQLVSVGGDGEVRHWNALDGTASQGSSCSVSGSKILQATLSPKARYAVVTPLDANAPILWDIDKCSQIAVLETHRSKLLRVVFSRDDDYFLTLGSDHTAHLWAASTGHEENVYAPNIGQLHTAAFDPLDGRVVLAGMRSAAVYRTLPSYGQQTKLEGHAGPVLHVAFSPDGKLLATASGDTTAILWDARTMTRLATLQGHTAALAYVAFAPDRAQLATASYDRTIRLFPITREQFLKMACELLLGHTSFYQEVEAYCRDPG